MQHESNKSDGEDRERNGEVVMLDSISLREKPNSTSDADASACIVRSQEKSLSTIVEIAHTLTGLCRLEAKLASVIERLRSLVQMRRGIVCLFEHDGGPEIIVEDGRSEDRDARCRVRLPQGAIDQIVASGQPLIVENVALHSAFSSSEVDMLNAGGHTRVAFIGVPIDVDGKVVGTLSIDRIADNGTRAQLDDDLRLLTMVASLLGQTTKLHCSFVRDRGRLMDEEFRLQKQLSELKPHGRDRKKVQVEGMIGDSPALRALLDKIEVISKSNSTVLLRGESGTGKELVAKAIHERSARAKRSFIKLNCAALTETVLESELFGHEKGAFTGAFNARKGRFEIADKGTLFLDEIGEISGSFQAKLLRVLQEQEFERVGGNQTIKVDVRVIAATNKNLEEAVARNEFRADLYYRISVVPLLLPPLRERRTDIPLLAARFLRNFNNENGRTLVFDSSAIEVLMNCGFPGNVRELENCVQRTATLARGSSIVRDDFACCHGQCLSALLWKCGPAEMARQPSPTISLPARLSMPPTQAATPIQPVSSELTPLGRPVVGAAKVTDRERVIAAMERSGWVQAKAARLLGLTPRQIGYALRRHGIEIKRF
ncbi:nif-specific transcriptional activator NifA [Bradyrhizobium sp. WSM471]|uniref:nif-specific transcriptional activator NifA n=1 Tax=Bradyrhizobium sp. WSM471 TaxID=319017 RepID=UPI0012FC4664|nr:MULTISPECIES: nif-specific transcriptional activator NifA [Bradyrhizobium]UFW42960.1 nif-specific transcriptional activator NifA [Bradyrhizobium canariense]